MFWMSFSFLVINFYGYVATLFALSKLLPLPYPKRREEFTSSKADPDFYVLVPCHNEAKFLAKKIENLLAQSYLPEKLRVIICDGGSTDGTRASVENLLGPRVTFLACAERGKIAQLNEGLRLVPPGALVAVSDADALLIRLESLHLAVDYLRAPGIGVVGAWGIPDPATAFEPEQAFWDKQNRLRYLESKACTSSIVTAQFYAFRRELIQAFPDDCVADDVYIAFLAHGSNQRVIYAYDIEAIELRQPRSHAELYHHKFRKANAYTTELLRQLYRLPVFSKRTKFLFLFKVYQFFYLPWIMVLFVICSVLYASQQRWGTLLAAYGILFCGTLLASMLVTPPPRKRRGGIGIKSALQTIYVFSLVNFVLLANSISFPFWVQNSRYHKVNQ